MACECALRGAGVMYVEERSAVTPAGFFDFGNQSEIEVISNWATVSNRAIASHRLLSMTLSANLYDFSTKNLEILSRATTTNVAAGSVASDPLVLYPERYTSLNPLPDEEQSLTLTSIGGGTTYTEGVDYARVNAGIIALPGGAIPTPVDDSTANVEASYSSLSTDTIEPYLNFGKNYRVIFDGWNKNNSTPFLLTLHNVSFSPSATFQVVLEEGYAIYPVRATLQCDPDIDPEIDSKSQYFSLSKFAC